MNEHRGFLQTKVKVKLNSSSFPPLLLQENIDLTATDLRLCFHVHKDSANLHGKHAERQGRPVEQVSDM